MRVRRTRQVLALARDSCKCGSSVSPDWYLSTIHANNDFENLLSLISTITKLS